MGRAELAFCAVAAFALAGCSSSEVLVAHSVDLVPATEEIPEEQLLDVAVAVFDPGVPEGEVDKEVLEELIREGTFVHIRRAEARYMAVQLRETLQKSGHWGTVWVTPAATTAADVNVNAEILHSDGDELRLRVNATDATGRVWIDDDIYEMQTAAGAFNRQRYPDLDPYQDVFNEIANDLRVAASSLSAKNIEDIRTVAELRFAEELSPAAFDGYVAADDGEYKLMRLPAADDPAFQRTLAVRQREHLFLETLNQHYSQFHDDSLEPYDGWRQYAREEAISVKELTRSARWRTGLGIATVIASVVYGSNSGNDGFSDRVIRDALMYMGMDVIRSGMVHRQEKRLHTETLEELSASFDEDVKPLVVEIEGTQHRLTGTAELQYEEWRQLLQQLYIEETGFIPEIDVYEDPQAAPALETVEVPQSAQPVGAGAPPEGAEPAAEADDSEASDAAPAAAESGAAATSGNAAGAPAGI